MTQDRAQGASRPVGATGITSAIEALTVLAVREFDQRAADAGHEYLTTDSLGALVDASCRCGGWSRWDAAPPLARVSWRMHASPSIIDAEEVES